MKTKVLSFLIWGLYRLFYFTWRVRVVESEEFKRSIKAGQPIILAHWHGDELALLHIVTRYGLSTMASTSKDGNLMNQVLLRLGGTTSRGSSTRGGAQALRGLIRLIKSGNPASIAVDGPKGPIYKVKPGVFELSKISGAKIYPLSATCTEAFHFKKSWNKTYLPRPFAKVLVLIDKDPLFINKTDPAKSPEFAENLEARLTNAKHKVCKLIAQT